MKISASTREQAAMLAQVAASNPVLYGNYAVIELELYGLGAIAAFYLAHAAWDHCWDLLYADAGTGVGDNTEALSALEAEVEALIRDGWVP